MRQMEIRVEGHLDKDWGKWLEGFTFTHNKAKETILTGKVEDQAALYGLIAKLRDLGVTLIAINVWGNEVSFPE